MGNAFIAVEGQHDVEVIAALLEGLGFHKEKRIEQLQDLFCSRLIETKFPYRGDLYARVPNPMFLSNGVFWVAVQACGGDSEIVRLIGEALKQLQVEPEAITAVGVIRDADSKSPAKQVSDLVAALAEIRQIPNYQVQLPSQPCEIAEGSPRFGIYILPDQESTGTVEDVLLECAQTVYAGLLAGAVHYVDHIDRAGLTEKDLELLAKPSGPKKAKVACVASILKPGMSLATSIDQNRWFDEEPRKLPRVQALSDFLKQLCGLP